MDLFDHYFCLDAKLEYGKTRVTNDAGWPYGVVTRPEFERSVGDRELTDGAGAADQLLAVEVEHQDGARVPVVADPDVVTAVVGAVERDAALAADVALVLVRDLLGLTRGEQDHVARAGVRCCADGSDPRGVHEHVVHAPGVSDPRVVGALNVLATHLRLQDPGHDAGELATVTAHVQSLQRAMVLCVQADQYYNKNSYYCQYMLMLKIYLRAAYQSITMITSKK